MRNTLLGAKHGVRFSCMCKALIGRPPSLLDSGCIHFIIVAVFDKIRFWNLTTPPQLVHVSKTNKARIRTGDNSFVDMPVEQPQWGTADAEIKVPSGEHAELKRSPFKAWCRSVYSHTCYACCQGFLPCLFLPFRSIYLHFFSKTSPDFFPVSCG